MKKRTRHNDLYFLKTSMEKLLVTKEFEQDFIFKEFVESRRAAVVRDPPGVEEFFGLEEVVLFFRF